MTRAEKAAELSALVFPPTSSEGIVQAQRLFDVIAAELGKTCATCEAWSRVRYPEDRGGARCTLIGGLQLAPRDGSGYCHRWEAKP